MAEKVKRIEAKEAHERLQTRGALLVCAYDDEKKSEKYHVPGAIHMKDFRAQADSLPKDRELIFYCA
jgi:rhodanese-related sulfurtransferase